jgi:hypothetical protein
VMPFEHDHEHQQRNQIDQTPQHLTPFTTKAPGRERMRRLSPPGTDP